MPCPEQLLTTFTPLCAPSPPTEGVKNCEEELQHRGGEKNLRNV